MTAPEDVFATAEVRARLAEAVERVAHFLPAQGPINIFIHHNTLHAFESRAFEDAVAAAKRKFSCEPYLPEEEYRLEFSRGRIADKDLKWALGSEHGNETRICAGITRFELRRRIAKYGVPEAAGPALRWLITDTDAIKRFRRDLPADALESIFSAAGPDAGDLEEGEEIVRALWAACLAAARRSSFLPKAASGRPSIRHRDLILAATGTDIDEWVHPVLIRILGAFLDQGIANWPIPGRERGFLACFLELYSHPWASLCGEWTSSLPALLAEERRRRPDPMASIHGSLEQLGVRSGGIDAYLEAEAMALRGWAGIVRQLEKRPDRVPAHSLPASLAEFLAVRLLLTRVALLHAARDLEDFQGPLSGLRAHLRARAPTPRPLSAHERAWPLFHAAQLCGLGAGQVDALSSSEIESLESELSAFDSIERRRILHAAFERHSRAHLCDALSSHSAAEARETPECQAIFCIDEREESFRRHLEEAAPGFETFGAAGYFGVAIYYKGATDAHPRPLCPISVKPHHYIEEAKTNPSAPIARWRRVRRRESGRLGKAVYLGSGTAVGGALIATLLGPLSIVALVLRVVFPGLARRWKIGLPLTIAPATKLPLDRRPATPPVGTYWGYTKEEMAGIVRNLLWDIGVRGRLAPIVVVLGHGSSSLNNPHESAHDCGACGGGRGGPNARAFAQMANDPAVRALLAKSGLRAPSGTWFIGAQRNTCDNSVEFYDMDLLPERLKGAFDAVAKAFTHARRREAHERCRRFESFPLGRRDLHNPSDRRHSGASAPLDGFFYGAALGHVEARSNDLAQPRPEYGHASNAFCIIGRRQRTRGLFLDRRAFLTSYDPTRDEDGAILERTLACVVPVAAGISLEYYFSRVDPTGYGCGTKLPHNVACLLGVMDGAQSDLRSGLPWQMVEIHEPTRLFVVVESSPDDFERALERLPAIKGLFDRRWLFAACIDPGSNEIRVREDGGYRAWELDQPMMTVRGDSASWYQGKRGHLPIVMIAGAGPSGRTV